MRLDAYLMHLDALWTAGIIGYLLDDGNSTVLENKNFKKQKSKK
jgi:hypothetical protein